jgi:hypothetical protein
VTGDPDTPDPADRTMQRLELTEALDEGFPQWRSLIGEVSRDGWRVGWLDPSTPRPGCCWPTSPPTRNAGTEVCLS